MVNVKVVSIVLIPPAAKTIMYKYLLITFILFYGCAFGKATGPLCGGEVASIWGFGILQKPLLRINCTNGEVLEFNNSNQLKELSHALKFLQDIKK